MAGLSPYRGPWNSTTAAHLLYRAGFGGTAQTIEDMVAAGMKSCVDRLVDYGRIPDAYPKPDWAAPLEGGAKKMRGASEAEKKAFLKQRRQEGADLKMWWIKRMVTTPRPLQEKLTLFWHGHFATSIRKVKLPYLMWLQNETLRKHASGNWKSMLKDISRDPAMVIWLDNATNRSTAPNENYARELMELFTLGEGHYSEDDIKESARAFTGYSVDREKQEFVFRKAWHDGKSKKFFNRRGNFDGEDIVEIILDQHQAAVFISRKIWEFFAYQGPSDQLVEQLANILRSSNYEFLPLLRIIFTSSEFYSDRSIKRQVKSPIQWLVGAVLSLQAELMPTRMINSVMNLLGQELFAPPNVKGWDGGVTWISTSTLLTRYNLANVLVNGVIPDEMLRPNGRGGGKKQGADKDEGPSMEDMLREERRSRALSKVKEVAERRLQRLIDPARIVDLKAAADGRQLVSQLVRVLYLEEMSARERHSVEEYVGDHVDEARVRGALHLLMSTPHYQLC